ncbi:MAG: leader peptide processing enzyme [Sphaerochaetaceae bacterium]|jgi:peptidoglycan/LPS O-acetylase OafA/YrhL|nr:leader peptide processing enzyme [Sphaerochaetaceae bacterium]
MSKSKKANTIWFMALATLLNIVLMVALFIGGFVLLSVLATENTSQTAYSIWVMVIFIASIGLSWLIYSAVVKAINKKCNLDDKLAPLWQSKRVRDQKKRQAAEERERGESVK